MKYMDSLINEQVTWHFVRLYPNYADMDYDERYYADESKEVISANLREMNLRTKRIRALHPELNQEEVTTQAFREVLTNHYCRFLSRPSDETREFIESHLDEVNRRFIDASELAGVKYLDFDPGFALATVLADIKLENRQKSIQ